MFTNDELLETPDYLLYSYQNQIFIELDKYMSVNNLSVDDVSKKLNVSTTTIKQILNGNFNYSFRRLIELGLMIGKVPSLEFIDPEEFWAKKAKRKINPECI